MRHGRPDTDDHPVPMNGSRRRPGRGGGPGVDDPHTDPFGWEPVPVEIPAARRPPGPGDTGPVPRHRGPERAAPAPPPGRARAGTASGATAASGRAAAARRESSRRAGQASRADARARGGTPGAAPGTGISTVAVPVAIGSLVAVALGVWARVHDPTGVAVNLAGFSGALAVKTWLATAAMALGLVQLWSALVVSGRVGRGCTTLVRGLHRWSGRAAVLVTVPVAVQCLIALGFSGATPRALVHSLLGCLFYGAFVTKMLLLRRPGVPGWVMGVAGGLVFAVLTGLWLTSAAWFFGTRGITF